MRDLFTDPDVVCQFLNGNQRHAITWFYKWILKSLEGVEVQEDDARRAATRSQMICALRYRNERSRLCKISLQWIVLWSRMVGSWPSVTFGGCRFFLQAKLWLKDQLGMLQQAKIMWDDNLIIQRLSHEMEFAVTYSIPDMYFAEELWIHAVCGASGLSRPQTVPGGYLKLNPSLNSPITISKRCKVIERSQRDCILEWARLNPEKFSLFLDRMATDPKWQISFRGLYDSLRLLYLRLFNEEARTVEIMELQLKYRIELMLAEESYI